MNAKFRDLVQCVKGDRIGLLAQVLSADKDGLHLFMRDFDGMPHRFTMPDDGAWTVVWNAMVGPKPNADLPEQKMPQKSALPPPLKPDEFLAPIPSDAKIVPIVDEASIPKVLPLPSPGKKEKLQRPRGLYPPSPRKYTALVRNASGEGITVSFGVKEGIADDRIPSKYTGLAKLL